MTIQDRLWDIAVDQYGYITTHDARNAGIPVLELSKLAFRHQLVRVAHGVYRFDQLPVTQRDEYMRAVLWTGRPEAALSHDTALAIYELCDINPDTIHLTVPKNTRIRRTGADYELHRQNLTATQLGWWEGIRAVTVPTAIEQGIQTGVASGLLGQALTTARARGLVTEVDHTRLRQLLTPYA